MCSSNTTMSWRRFRRRCFNCCSNIITSRYSLRIGKLLIIKSNLNDHLSFLFKVVLDCAPGLIGELISLLGTMDDLNSAASSIMNLLAKLLASNSAEKYRKHIFFIFHKYYFVLFKI